MAVLRKNKKTEDALISRRICSFILGRLLYVEKKLEEISQSTPQHPLSLIG